ncbi:DDE_3 domain-containing protein [Trichonephila clavipes]|uniref:DDE_3 domain-containing protein n=1 Tax=Trichonephila clavipes TaxID=2585209 RepID=A0A8X6SWE5_TRICX|nr:DDE_3 domain-containing protein [Trichonephila clavipes]
MSQIGKRLCLVMNPGLFWGQMITVYGSGGALVSGTIPPSHTVLRHTALTAGVMVWGAIVYDSRSTLIGMRRTLMGQRYVDDILRPHVGPFINGLQGEFSYKIMLVRIQQELLKTSYVIFRLFHGRPASPICPL